MIQHRIRAWKAPPRQQNRRYGLQFSKPETKVGFCEGMTGDAPLEGRGIAEGGRTMKEIVEKNDGGSTSGARGNFVRRKCVEGEMSVGSIQLKGGGRLATFSSVYPNPVYNSCTTTTGLHHQEIGGGVRLLGLPRSRCCYQSSQ
ncbi:unnamed protein product [Tuber melanosporum]|uniref:(Perigord truffle) hypothetical protein n=1 Tax=Tuber melanosporum (strain Mel28) TaxID=656061 RepID=D5GD07_TUBMM|nr:uncharacterized protein GSTUM_00000910001 [Tuber melanosporum]CAZ82400.1 unnamed protein product [Tuber melanosporum]